MTKKEYIEYKKGCKETLDSLESRRKLRATYKRMIEKYKVVVKNYHGIPELYVEYGRNAEFICFLFKDDDKSRVFKVVARTLDAIDSVGGE